MKVRKPILSLGSKSVYKEDADYAKYFFHVY